MFKRFMSKVNKTETCWLWTGGKSKYGMFSLEGKNVGAHRVSYELFNGDIPDGYVVRHSCDNPRCVNPEHLSVGTQQDNINDAVSRNRHVHGETVGNHKLSRSDVEQIRKSTLTVTELAELHGVHFGTIYRILNGTIWRHI